MKTETITILEQLCEAINGAHITGRTMYAFRQDDRWWYSGKLPHDAAEFYIAYPSGNTDRSPSAPAIGPDEWDAYSHARGGKPIIAPPRKTRKAGVPKPEVSPFMGHFRKYFTGYCAFAPHIAFCMCAVFATIAHLTPEAMWSLALPVCLVCVPLTLIWIVCALQRAQSEAIGILGSTLAIEAHFSFYIHLGLVATRTSDDSGMFLFTVLGSLAFSGIALLLLWDTQPKVE